MFTIDPRARLKAWAVKGFMYGYPQCCIEEFVERGRAGKRPHAGPWDGSGFIPCKAHLKEATADFRAFVEKHITPNRVYDKPFPLDEGGGESYKWPKQRTKRNG